MALSGQDSAALAALPGVDLASFHLYPDGWGKDAAWGTQWIRTHVQVADRVHKPVMLGEFGLKDKATRNTVYQAWTDEAVRDGIDGFQWWLTNLEGLVRIVRSAGFARVEPSETFELPFADGGGDWDGLRGAVRAYV